MLFYLPDGPFIAVMIPQGGYAKPRRKEEAGKNQTLPGVNNPYYLSLRFDQFQF